MLANTLKSILTILIFSGANLRTSHRELNFVIGSTTSIGIDRLLVFCCISCILAETVLIIPTWLLLMLRTIVMLASNNVIVNLTNTTIALIAPYSTLRAYFHIVWNAFRYLVQVIFLKLLICLICCS